MALELGVGQERSTPRKSRSSCRFPSVPRSKSWTLIVSGTKRPIGRSFSDRQRRHSVPHRCTLQGSDRDRARPTPPRLWALRDGKGGSRSAVVPRAQSAPPLGSHPGSRRHSDAGSRRSAEKIHRSRPGDQITVWPRARPRTMSDATLEGSTAKGAGESPLVILVRTKPGRTICTVTPLPRRDSLNPCPKPSSPAFAEP